MGYFPVQKETVFIWANLFAGYVPALLECHQLNNDINCAKPMKPHMLVQSHFHYYSTTEQL